MFENCDHYDVWNRETYDKLDFAVCLDCSEGYGEWEMTGGCERCEDYFPQNDWTGCTECKIDETGIPVECLACGDEKTL